MDAAGDGETRNGVCTYAKVTPLRITEWAHKLLVIISSNRRAQFNRYVFAGNIRDPTGAEEEAANETRISCEN